MLLNYIIYVPNAIMLSVYSIIRIRNPVRFLNAARPFGLMVFASALCYANCGYCCSCFEFDYIVSNSTIRSSNSIFVLLCRVCLVLAINNQTWRTGKSYGIVCEQGQMRFYSNKIQEILIDTNSQDSVLPSRESKNTAARFDGVITVN